MELIGLKGLKGSGKDTMGDYLVANYGFERVSFAKPMKASAAACLGLPADPEFFEEMKNDPDARITLKVRGKVILDISVREYLQFFGTDGHRNIPEFGQDVWVNMLAPKLIGDGRYVATDSRFANECATVKALGGTVIRIQRDAVEDGDTHASEADVDEALIDTVLYNSGTIEDFERTVEAYMKIRYALASEEILGSVGIAEVG